MLIREVITESKVVEKAPVGIFKQGFNKLKGALGSAKGKAATDVGARANEIYKNFRDWGLRSGVDMKAAPAADIKSWFKTQNLIFPKQFASAKFINLTDKKVSSQFWNAAATSAFKGAGNQGSDLGGQYGLASQNAPTDTGAAGAGGDANLQKVQAVAQQLSDITSSLTPAQRNALKRIIG